jgi:hypothetical protein
MSYLPIENYGLIGNLNLAALLGINATIDMIFLQVGIESIRSILNYPILRAGNTQITLWAIAQFVILQKYHSHNEICISAAVHWN